MENQRISLELCVKMLNYVKDYAKILFVQWRGPGTVRAQDLFCSRQTGMHVYAGVKKNLLTSEQLAYRL